MGFRCSLAGPALPAVPFAFAAGRRGKPPSLGDYSFVTTPVLTYFWRDSRENRLDLVR